MRRAAVDRDRPAELLDAVHEPGNARSARDHQKEMVLGSMAISILLLVIAAIFAGVPGVLAVCAALAVIAITSAR